MNDVRFLNGRTAIVTGGTTGIGRAIAQALADHGANVVVCSRQASARPLGEEFTQYGRRVVAHDVDVTSAASVQALFMTTRKTFGHVAILVNSAGIMPDHLLADHPDELWHETVAVNLTGVYQTIKACLPSMIEQQWGRIVNIASTAASVSAPGFGAYSATKAGVVGLTRAVALEGAPHGVTCNAISPGWVETEMALAAIGRYAAAEGQEFAPYLANIKASNPQQRMIQPAEVASLVLYLCRDDALAMTMQDLRFAAGSLW
ncbi:MAG TPA: SDR family oxidoreductase [Caldilineaceae bacterium]|nr:SDR family oxidoreductase [Caldilineaceae bacterium]